MSHNTIRPRSTGRSLVDGSNVHIRNIVLRYPIRVFQSDTIVVPATTVSSADRAANESRPGDLRRGGFPLPT